MSPEMLINARELHSRTTDGIDVRLLWCQDDDRVFVAVNDRKTGQAFSVDVPRGEHAMSVFHHPFAFAA